MIKKMLQAQYPENSMQKWRKHVENHFMFTNRAVGYDNSVFGFIYLNVIDKK